MKTNLKHTHNWCFFKCRRSLNTRRFGMGASIEVKAASQEPPPGMMIPEALVSYIIFWYSSKSFLQNMCSTQKSSLPVWYGRKKQNKKTCHRKFVEFHAKNLDIGGHVSIPSLFLIFFKAQNVERVDLEDFLKIVPWNYISSDTLEGLESMGDSDTVDGNQKCGYITS